MFDYKLMHNSSIITLDLLHALDVMNDKIM